MNHQYMHQQQQQQQQPGYFGGAPPYDGLTSNVSQNIAKGPPAGPPQPQAYAPQKPPQGPPQPPGNMPPPAHSPYYNNNMQAGNPGPPPSASPHIGLPPSNQSNLSNQMSNMSLGNQQQRPSPASFPRPAANSNTMPAGGPPNVNGFNAPTEDTQSESVGPREAPGQMSRPLNQQGLPPSQQPPSNSTPFARHSNDAGPQYRGGPPHPGGPGGPGGPPMGYPAPGQQRPPMNPYMGQPNLSGPPPPPGQQNFSGQPNMPPPGQQNFSGQPNMPPPPGPQGMPGPGAPYQMGGPPAANPPGQMVGNVGGAQRQYMSGPPMPGQQPVVSPTNRIAPPVGYPQQFPQQSHQPDPYAGQRGGGVPYQGGMPGAPGVGGAGGYQPGGAPQPRRLDPDQMPSPIQVMQDDQRNRNGVFITNQKGLVPPLVTTKYTTQDQGNASPRFIRSTMYTVPTTNDIMKQTGVPFGLIISPMAQVVDGEFEPPIVDMGEIGPVRCIRCKSYMSPFMQFIDAGRRFQCMLCKATSEVPQEYFQHLDHTGQRMDRYERPELMLGTYEYTATTDYCKNNVLPKPPAVIFVIDVSYNTVKSGLVNLLCSEMKKIIRNLPVDAGQTKSNMKVGFITYNNTVHFYNVNACLTQPQMMVVGDVQDVFMPLLDGFLCDVEESEAVIDALMTQIPVMFADTRETETILAPAIQAGLEALKASERPGKLMVFHSSLPIAEAPGKLKNRDDRKVLGTEKEKTVLAPQTNVYNNLGQECVAAGCSVDLFVFNNSYVDIATIGQICRLTGGEVYKYTYFQADTDGERLITDIVNNISRPIAFDAVMRVRTSTGVRATDFYGHFFMSNTTDMDLASIDCNKAVAIEIKHDDKLTDEEGVYVQAALLYTSCGGVRRLRVINLSLRTSSQMAELYRACDLDAVINFFSKQCIFKLMESSPKSVKDGLIARCATILAAYRKHCASPSSAGQLILPECMKLLPLYVNCLLKSDAISGGADMTIDDRSYAMQAVATMPVYTSVIYFYPRLLPLDDVDPNDTELPQQLRCSFDKFTEEGAYLLENGIHMFLWIGHNISSEWMNQVFGGTMDDSDRTSIPVLDTPLNKRIRDIIHRVRAERHHCMRLTIVRQKEKLEMVLRHFLVEDRGNDTSPSYVDFLCHMHKEIKTVLSQ